MISLTLLAFNPAPASLDGSTIALWVIGVLVVFCLWVCRALWTKIEEERKAGLARQAKCEAEHAKAWGEVQERDREILQLTRKYAEAMERHTAEAKAMHERQNEFMREAMATLEGVSCLGSGRHKVIRELDQGAHHER